MVDPGLYPFQSRYWDRGGLKYHYIDEGGGEPVVMVHGNPTWSFYYRNLALALRERYRVIVPDHIGMGLSDKPANGRYEYTLKSRVDDLENFLASLGVNEGVTLIMHDWGGMIATAYACRKPSRIRRLVVLNTAAFFPESKALPWQLALSRTAMGAFLVRGLNLFSLGAAAACVRRPLPPEVRRAYLAPYDSWKNRIAVLRFVQDIPLKAGDASYELVRWTEERLGSLRHLPMLIAWGLRDFVFDEDFLSGWIRRFPEAEVHPFPEAGHYVLEDAGPEIEALVKDFLARK